MLTAFAPCSHLTKGPVGSAWAHTPFRLQPRWPLPQWDLSFPSPSPFRPQALSPGGGLRGSRPPHSLPHSLCGLGAPLTSGGGSAHPRPGRHTGSVGEPCGAQGRCSGDVSSAVITGSTAAGTQARTPETPRRCAWGRRGSGLTVRLTAAQPYGSIFRSKPCTPLRGHPGALAVPLWLGVVTK